MSDIAISLKNVSKYYKLYNKPKDRLKEALSRSNKSYHKKFYATKNLNLEIKKGEILGIVGKNGSGKSTLLKLITGVLVPDEGSIKVNGKISALLELGSGFNPEFTGMQNIFFYGTILGFTKKEMKEKLNDILNFADIGEFIDQPLKTYSSGMKSRLGFAVAVHIDPEILILDEVLAVGDILFKRKCYAKMEEFFKGGKTIIYVSHDANSIKQLCTRAIFLLEGSIIMDSDAKSVTQQYERYLFANEKDQDHIKKELLHFNKSHHKATINKSVEISNKQPLAAVKKTTIDSEQYLPTLISDPTHINKNFASFDHISIYNNKNNIVNVLQLNHRYNVSFNVIFHEDSEDAYIGVQIFSIKGVLISGTNTKDYMENELFSVNKGKTYDVSLEFDCLILPGVYLIKIFAINKNCSAIINDAYMFKVQNETWNQGGLVHLNQKINVKSKGD